MEVNTTTLPPMKYWPYDEVEYKELKEVMDTITTHIPHDRMSWVWNNHNKILKTKEAQPCSCGSAAAHWKRAADTIREFINRVETING